MATAPLVPKQIEPLFQKLTLAVGGLQLTQTQPNNPLSSVRLGWQTQGQPASQVQEDIIYVRAIEDDDLYNRQRDINTLVNPQDDATLLQVTTYVRVWKVFWTVLGPNSFDNARLIHSALMTDLTTKYLLAKANLYLVTDVVAPLRVPDQWPGGEWGERVDFSARFNEQVTEVPVEVNKVASVEIIIDDATSPPPLADFVVNAPPTSISYVDGAAVALPSAGTSLTIPYNPAEGNIVVVSMCAPDSITGVTCTDSRGNVLPGTGTGGVWQFQEFVEEGVDSFTLTWTGSAYAVAILSEYSGVDSLGQLTSANGTSQPATAMIISSGANSLLSAALATENPGVDFTAITGTLRAQISGPQQSLACLDNTVPAALSALAVAALMTGGTNTWVSAAIELKPSA